MPLSRTAFLTKNISLENQRELLRKVRTQARNVDLEQRELLRYAVHGEVHGRLEPGQLCLPPKDTAGSRQQLPHMSYLTLPCEYLDELPNCHYRNLRFTRGCLE